MSYNSIADIEKKLNTLTLFPLRQIGRNVGVPRHYALPMGKLRDSILAIAKGEIAPLPYYKRHIYQDPLMYHQDLVDAVLAMYDANANK